MSTADKHGALLLRTGLALLLALAGAAAMAQSRPTRIIVPFAAGGASDTYTRIVAQKITEQTGKAFVVENRTGAGGRIARQLRGRTPGPTRGSAQMAMPCTDAYACVIIDAGL